MHRTQVYLEESQYEALRARARREGRSLASVIREIIDVQLGVRYAGGLKDPFRGVIGVGEGDGSAVAENYEDYLYGGRS